MLQVGKSYYKTAEFRRAYPLQPASQFGIGFLSVFAESDRVVVETRAATQPTSLRLRLTGIRNYLLTERGDQQELGTRVEVVLRRDITGSQLAEAVTQWCRILEFPVFVRTPEGEVVVRNEVAADYESEVPDVVRPDAHFKIRAFPVRTDVLTGHLFVRSYVDDRGGESWARQSWADFQYPDLAPDAAAPQTPPSLVCVQGLATQLGGISASGWSSRVDIRGPVEGLTLARSLTGELQAGVTRQLQPRWREVITSHLDSTALALPPDGWRYVQQLMRVFEHGFEDFWLEREDSVRVWRGSWELNSLRAVAAESTLQTARSLVFEPSRILGTDPTENWTEPEWVDAIPSFGVPEVWRLSPLSRRMLFGSRQLVAIDALPSRHLVARWEIANELPWQRARQHGAKTDVLGFPNRTLVGFPYQSVDDSVYERYVMNSNHPFVRWCMRVAAACERGEFGLRFTQAERLYSLVASPVGYSGLNVDDLNRFTSAWRTLDLPESLRPPMEPLTREAFAPSGQLAPARRPENADDW